MDRELTFHPESEQARDLNYSEYSSCDRSVHLLIQESPAVPYEVLLKLYRETVAAYLSSDEIRPPEDFLENLLSIFDQLAAAAGLPIDRWRAVGIHLLYRTKNAFYLVTSRENEVLVGANGSLEPLAETCAAEKLRLDRSGPQRELFPTKLGDLLSVLQIDSSRTQGRTLVLGCAASDRDAVLETLSSPVWTEGEEGAVARATRRSIVSAAVSQRIVVVRLGSEARAETAARPLPRRRVAFPRIRLSRRSAVWAGAAIAAGVLAVSLWKAGGERKTAADEAARARSGDISATDRESARPEGAAGEGVSAPGLRLSEAWRRRLGGAVTSSPAVSGDKVIVGCRDGTVYAFDRANGSTLWTFSASGGVGASPAIQGDNVIVADYNGYVYSVSVADGRQAWRAKLAAGVVSSPAVIGDRVVVCGLDGYAYCLSALDGQIVWKRKTGGRVRGSAAAADGAFLVPSYDGYLYSLSAVLGTVRWRSRLGGPVSASPGAGEGRVAIGGPDGKIVCLGAADGAPHWNFTAGDAVKSSLAIAGGRVLFGSNDGCVYCLDLANGSLLWKYQTGGIVLARPAESDGVVYAGSYDGRMYALGSVDGKPVGAFEAGGEIFSSPAIDEETVYFGTNAGELVALRRGGN
jgi:outer membrane protein assembly factor BamB